MNRAEYGLAEVHQGFRRLKSRQEFGAPDRPMIPVRGVKERQQLTLYLRVARHQRNRK